MKLSRGFTLIELLIAISIIAILSALGLTAYQSVYKTSRDAKRKSDLKLIQSTLEQYHADQKYYPSSVTPNQALSFGSKVYINKVPSDTTSPNYLYQPSGSGCPANPQNCTSYCLFVKLENLTGVTSDSACTNYPGGGYNYGVTRP